MTVRFVFLLAACGSTPSSRDGTYSCTVVQIRNDACSCGEPAPPGTLAGVADGTAFTMTIEGERITSPGSFDCTGTWSGASFACMVEGCPYSGCTACGTTCPGTQLVILPSDPDPGRPLGPRQIYLGTTQNNSFNAHCGRS
jgi:hypothetical protein